MQAVFRFLPDDGIGRIHELSGNLFVAMCGQAMHIEGIGCGDIEQRLIQLIGRQRTDPFRLFGFLSRQFVCCCRYRFLFRQLLFRLFL